MLVGAETNQVDFTYSKQISRMWDMGLNTGYAHNRSVRELAIGNVDLAFNTWRAGTSFSRPLGRTMRMFLNYNAQWQSAKNCGVTPTACGPDLLRHHFAVGFSWQSNPINLE